MFEQLQSISARSGAPATLDSNPQSLIGSIFVGHTVNWLLLGSLIVQLYVYEKGRQSTKDTIWLRILVYSVVVVDSVQTIFVTYLFWHETVGIWGNSKELTTVVPWSSSLIPILSGIVALLVQLFYAWRIWALSQAAVLKALAALVVMLSLTQFGASIPATTIILVAHNEASALLSLDGSIDVWLSGSFTGDVVIAGCMIWLLSQARSRTVWVQSQSLYDRLIINTVQTGLMTAVVAGVDLALWKVYPRKGYYLGAGILLGKLYSNSFLSTLNSRIFRQDQSRQTSSALPTYNSQGKLNTWWPKRQVASPSAGPGIQVHVLRDQERHTDRPQTGRMVFENRSAIQSRGGQLEDWKTSATVDRSIDADEHVLELSDLSGTPLDVVDKGPPAN